MSAFDDDIEDDEPALTGRFVVVAPNEAVFADLGVLLRLEAFLGRCFPHCDIEVARVAQPRIETFTVIPMHSGTAVSGLPAPDDDQTERGVAAISDVLRMFDPYDATPTRQ